MLSPPSHWELEKLEQALSNDFQMLSRLLTHVAEEHDIIVNNVIDATKFPREYQAICILHHAIETNHELCRKTFRLFHYRLERLESSDVESEFCRHNYIDAADLADLSGPEPEPWFTADKPLKSLSLSPAP
jgi:hypothetical protein